MAGRFEGSEQPRAARTMRRRAAEAGRQALLVRDALASAALTSLREVNPNGQETELDQLDESEQGLAS
jgi:hypothetical protein